jgi:NADH-quinone oxidoreductase subunit L
VPPEVLPHALEGAFHASGAGDGLGPLGSAAHGHLTAGAEALLMLASIGLAVAGFLIAAAFYRGGGDLAARAAAGLGGAYRLAADRFRVDELYDATILRAFRTLCTLSDAFDRFVIDLAVNVSGILAEIAGHGLKVMQTGAVRAYAVAILAGAVALLYLVLAGGA